MRLKRSTLHRVNADSGGQPSTDGIHELAASRWNSPAIARRLVVSYTAFSPLPPILNCQFSIVNSQKGGRSFSSSISSRHRLLLLSEVERPVLPGLSSRPTFQKGQRQTAAVLSELQRYK